MKNLSIIGHQQDTVEQQKKIIQNLVNNGGKFRMIGKIVKLGTTKVDVPNPDGTIHMEKMSISRGIKGVVVLDINNEITFNIDRDLIPELNKQGILKDVKIDRKLVSPKFDVSGAFPQYTNIDTLLDFNDSLPHVLVDRFKTDTSEMYLVMVPGFFNKKGRALILDKAEMINMFTCDSPPYSLVNAKISRDRNSVNINKARW